MNATRSFTLQPWPIVIGIALALTGLAFNLPQPSQSVAAAAPLRPTSTLPPLPTETPTALNPTATRPPVATTTPTPGGLPTLPPATNPAMPFATPVGGQGLGTAGGVFQCALWTVTVPGGDAPERSTLHCGAYDPNVAPPAPNGYQMLRHTINVHLYNSWGSWVTTFTTPLQFCLTYTNSDLAAAGGTPGNFVIQTAPIGGAWSALTTSVNQAARQVCASVNHLTLFDLSVRGGAGTSIGPSFTYTVQWGDTLFRIALRFNTTVAALQAANGLSSNTIYPGQVLVVAGVGRSSTASTTAPDSAAVATAPSGVYIVQAGDNLFRIALNHGVSLSALMAANGLSDTWIYPGQSLIIP